ncbi:hypothetical protein BV898_12568 [Hypsibius exemplaris]|uniref:Uncharacterized protein n=1 Tax=Hypsibius exemplaris TaxID=2072580 RepID=A0A1W0WDI3_HYPEX|nr:hypothetical protein BV898_12568 [Hypsibius exemplaris]
MCQTKGVCPQCSSAMSIGKKKEVFAFRCKDCKGSLSMRHGGFLEGSHISYQTILSFFAQMCAWRTYTQVTISAYTGRSERAVSDWCTLVKETISVYLGHTPVILGGPGEVGYADGVWIGTTQK